MGNVGEVGWGSRVWGGMEREWAGQLVGPGLLGRSPRDPLLFFVSYFSVLFLFFLFIFLLLFYF